MALHFTKGVRDEINNNYFHKIDISGTIGGTIGVDFRTVTLLLYKKHLHKEELLQQQKPLFSYYKIK